MRFLRCRPDSRRPDAAPRPASAPRPDGPDDQRHARYFHGRKEHVVGGQRPAADDERGGDRRGDRVRPAVGPPGFKTRDAKIIAIGTSMSIANPSSSPEVICTPACPAHKSCRAPGAMKVRMSAKTMLNMTTTQSVESLVPMSFTRTHCPAPHRRAPLALSELTGGEPTAVAAAGHLPAGGAWGSTVGGTSAPAACPCGGTPPARSERAPRVRPRLEPGAASSRCATARAAAFASPPRT